MSLTILLVGAVFASLAFGVLLAYGICLAMFRIFHIHVQSTARRGLTAGVSVNANR